MVDFGNRLKKLRTKNNFTQEQLAQRLGLTKSVVSAYETGARMPSYEALITIARIFHVSTDFLLGVDNRCPLDTSGLSKDELAALQNLIWAMKRN